MARFRVLRGVHAEKDDDGVIRTYEARTDADGNPIGDIVDSKSDLCKPPHNTRGSIRFQRVDDVEPIKSVLGPDNDDLSAKTLAELRALAEEHQIDLGEAVRKADILETIRSELNAVGA